jgi:AAHS family 3-hydroxyphenylpropionic acid transporter
MAHDNLPTSTTHPLRIAVLWLCGILAAMQFAKIAVAFVELQAHYLTSSASMGWILSTVGLVGLLLGVTMGLLAPRIGYRRLLLAGLSLGALLALAQSFLLPLPWFWASRVLEGASHLAIVVAAPTLMASNAAPQHRSIAMGLWSTFVGVAFAITGAVGLPFVDHFGLAALFQVHALALACATGAVLVLFPADANRRSFTTLTAWGQIPLHLQALLRQHVHIYTRWTTALPGLCFLGYTSMAVALLTFLPQQAGASRAWLAVTLPLMGVAGTFCAGWIAQVWMSPLRLSFWAFVGVGLIGLSFGIATETGWWMAPMALALMFVAGLSGGSSFAMIPFLNDEPSQQARANGAVAQMGNLGSTLGPPAFALAISSQGQHGLVLGVLLCAALGVMLALWGSAHYQRAAT